MKKEDKYLVSLVKKYPIYENKNDIYLYTYVSTIIGKNSEDEKFFIDESGNKYPNIDNWKESLKEDFPFACIGQISIEEMAGRFHIPVSNNLENICNAYHENAKRYCYLAFFNPKEEKKIVPLDIDSIKENATYLECKDEDRDKNKEKNAFNRKGPFLAKNNSIYVDNLEMIKIDKLLPKIIKQMPSQEEPIKKLLLEINKTRLGKNISKESIVLFGLDKMIQEELLESISSYIKRPVLVINVTKIPNPNYMERYIEDLLCNLYNQWDGNIEKLEQAIIFFEEVNKDFPNKESILKQIGSFVEGETYYLSDNLKIKTNTMTKIIGFSKEKQKIGFHLPGNSVEEIETKEIVKRKIQKLDFIKTLPTIIEFNNLNLNDYKVHLKYSKYSPMNIQKEKFEQLGAKLTFTENIYDSLAKNIYTKKINNAEALSFISEVTNPSFAYLLENRKRVEEIKIDKKTLEDNSKYKIKYKI